MYKQVIPSDNAGKLKPLEGVEATLKIVINDTYPGDSRATMTFEKHEAAYGVAKIVWSRLGDLHRFVEALIMNDQPHGIEFTLVMKLREEKRTYVHHQAWDNDGFHHFDGYKSTRHSMENVAAVLVNVVHEWIAERADSLRRDAIELRDTLRSFRAQEDEA